MNVRYLFAIADFVMSAVACFHPWLILIDRYTGIAERGDLSRNCDIAIPTGETEVFDCNTQYCIYFCAVIDLFRGLT